MIQTPCATCEYLGNAAFPVVDQWNGQGLLGFSNRLNGPVVFNPSYHCEHEKMRRTLVYKLLPVSWPCQYYKEREWTRPEKCGDCDLRAVYYDDGTFLCSGYPFVVRRCSDDPACINGKSRYGRQISLF